jgi:AraC-like DNA-binding protein
VPAFLRSLAHSAETDAASAQLLVPHAIGLISAAAAFADRATPTGHAVDALAREQVVRYLHQHLADHRLDVDRVAAGCAMSRRTLYRVLGSDGVASYLRRIRIERAKAMLLGAPHRPVAAIASACGFDSESGFHRAFRTATGGSPGEYRRRHQPGTAGQ